MIGDYSVLDAEERRITSDTQIPAYESEFMNAKMFLQLASTNTGDNLYDHLCETLNKILSERPLNVIDFFEEYSQRMKEKRYRPMTDHLEDIYVPPCNFPLATTILPMLKPLPPDEPSTVDPADLEVADMSQNNMLELLYYLEHCGLGLPRQEMFFIMLSMRKLIHTEPISSIRFWGKIFGTVKNYIIVECELKNEEHIKRNETYEERSEENKKQEAENLEILEENRIRKALDEIARIQQFGGEGSKYPRLLPSEPKIQYVEIPEPPSEPSGVGLNKLVYYVCTGIGEPWCQLPDVTPKQIRTSRQIYKSFTGNLEEPILTFPDFPGKEQEYLRAQIARISAGTQIAPLGYYTFGEEELGEGAADEEEMEEPEEGAGKSTSFRKNPNYEPLRLKDLLDPSMAFWVHFIPFILPQGRTTWWNPYPMPEGAGEDEESAIEEEQVEEEEYKDEDIDKTKLLVEPETGPPLLTALSEDAVMEAIPPWSVRCSSNIMDDFAIAIVRSNLWPGAFSFSTQGKYFQNLYLGYGLKYMEHNFSPTPLSPVEQEYPIDAEVLEIEDPTGAEEESWRIDHLPTPIELPLLGEEIGEGGEEGEEEEEEEDV